MLYIFRFFCQKTSILTLYTSGISCFYCKLTNYYHNKSFWWYIAHDNILPVPAFYTSVFWHSCITCIFLFHWLSSHSSFTRTDFLSSPYFIKVWTIFPPYQQPQITSFSQDLLTIPTGFSAHSQAIRAAWEVSNKVVPPAASYQCSPVNSTGKMSLWYLPLVTVGVGSLTRLMKWKEKSCEENGQNLSAQ